MAIVSFALLAPVGPLVVERRLHIVANLASESPDGPLSPELQRRVNDPVIGAGLAVMLAWLLGIIVLMTMKPLLIGAILVMLAAALVGILAGVPLWFTRERTKSIVT